MLSVVIAGSRTVDPSIEVVDAAMLRLLEDNYQNLLEVLLATRPLVIPQDTSVGESLDWTSVIGRVICGEADGGDNAGDRWGACRGVERVYEPITPQDIAEHGKYKGPRMRNRRMAERGDCLLAFWDGVSGGTADMSIRMQVRGKPQLVVPTKPVQRPRRRRGRSQALDRALVTQ
jgi:hypothetical protein